MRLQGNIFCAMASQRVQPDDPNDENAMIEATDAKQQADCQTSSLGEKGLQTRQKIVDAARETLIEKGYDHFVLRQIAKKSGVKPGNLQYYFKNKRDLLNAVLVFELRRYEDTYARVAEGNLNLRDTITAAFEFLVQEIGMKSTTSIWYVVWSAAQHDAEIAGIMRDWYKNYTISLQNLFLRSSPNLPARRAGHIAVIITALIDGLMIQIGHGKKPGDIHTDIESACVEMLHSLATESA